MWRVYLAVETLVVRRWSRCQVGQTRTSYMYCCYSGWWFGTWLVWLSIYWECHHPNWLIQRGWNHQPVFVANLCGFWSQLNHYWFLGKAAGLDKQHGQANGRDSRKGEKVTKDVLFFQVDLSETGIYTYINIYISIYIYTHVSPMLLSGWSSNGPWLRKVW